SGARRAVGAGLVLALIAGPVFAWRQRVALPPVAVTALLQPRPGHPAERPLRVLLPDFARLRRTPPWQRLVGRNQDFVLEIEAWLWVPRTATHRLELTADDKATLGID